MRQKVTEKRAREMAGLSKNISLGLFIAVVRKELLTLRRDRQLWLERKDDDTELWN